MKKTALEALVNVLLGVVIAVVVILLGGFTELETMTDRLRVASDGFFVAAALLLGWGGLRWAVAGGAVDGLGYSMKTLKDRLLPNPRYQRQESFADYRMRKHAKDTSPAPLLLGGMVHLVISVALVLAYTRIV